MKILNPTYLQLSTVDVAKMLGVDRTTVRIWCKKEIINCMDVSEPGSSVPRYVIPEDEVEKIKRAMKRHGAKKWTKHYNKTKYTRKNQNNDSTTELQVEEIQNDVSSDNIEEQHANDYIDNSEITPDKIKNTLIYIREIKTRLADIEIEKTNLLKDLEDSKKEVLAFIE